MEQRDIIKDEIARIGQMIGRILEYFQGKNSVDLSNPHIQQLKVQLKEEIDLDLDLLIELPLSEFINQTRSTFRDNPGNLESLADLLLYISDQYPKEKQAQLLEKAKQLLIFVQENATTYSIDRQLKIDCIQLP